MKPNIIGKFPNPIRRTMRIRFGLPFGFSGKVRFTIFDAHGKLVWGAVMRGHGGEDELVWNGRNQNGRSMSAGLYILQMTALNSKNNIVGGFEKRLTFMP